MDRKAIELNMDVNNNDYSSVEFKPSNKFEAKQLDENEHEELEASSEHEYLDGEENSFGVVIIKTRTMISELINQVFFFQLTIIKCN
jgi:hypothetical protein